MAASISSTLKITKLHSFTNVAARCLSLSSINKSQICSSCLQIVRLRPDCIVKPCQLKPNIQSPLHTQVFLQERPYSQQAEAEEEELDVLYKKVMVEVKGHDPAVLKSYKQYVIQAARGLDIKLGQIDTPKYHAFRQSVLSSVHVFKKHQTQYEQRTHFVIFEFLQLTGSTADTFLEYIQRNLPEGVAMKVTKYQLEPMPDHMKPPVSTQ